MLLQIDPADLLDGGFNLVGMIFFIIAIFIATFIYFRKRTPTNAIYVFSTIGGALYTLGNLLDKWQLWDGDMADAFCLYVLSTFALRSLISLSLSPSMAPISNILAGIIFYQFVMYKYIYKDYLLVNCYFYGNFCSIL